MQEEPNTLLFLQEERERLLLSFNSLLFLLEATGQERNSSDMWQVCPGKRLPVSTHFQAHLHPETCMTECWDVTSKLFLQNCFFARFFLWCEQKLNSAGIEEAGGPYIMMWPHIQPHQVYGTVGITPMTLAQWSEGQTLPLLPWQHQIFTAGLADIQTWLQNWLKVKNRNTHTHTQEWTHRLYLTMSDA